MSSRHTYLTFPSQPSALLVQESWWRPLVWLGWVGLVYQAAWVGVYLTSHPFCSPHESYPENWPQNYMSVSCESGFWTTEKWKVKKKCHSLFSRSASEFFFTWDRDREMKVKWKWLEIEIEKWKWNEKASRSRSEISREFSRIFENLKIITLAPIMSDQKVLRDLNPNCQTTIWGNWSS